MYFLIKFILDKYMLKTISEDEFFFFRKLLKPYYLYMQANKNTLITKIYGVHKIKLFLSKKK